MSAQLFSDLHEIHVTEIALILDKKFALGLPYLFLFGVKKVSQIGLAKITDPKQTVI